jgi:hypothetical protein
MERISTVARRPRWKRVTAGREICLLPKSDDSAEVSKSEVKVRRRKSEVRHFLGSGGGERKSDRERHIHSIDPIKL